MVVSQSSDACCAITPFQPGRPCRKQAAGGDARLNGDEGQSINITFLAPIKTPAITDGLNAFSVDF